MKLVFYSSNTASSRGLRSFKLVIFFEQGEENILKRNVEITLQDKKRKKKKKGEKDAAKKCKKLKMKKRKREDGKKVEGIGVVAEEGERERERERKERERERRNKEISLRVACYYEGGGRKRRRSLCRGCLVGSSEAPTRCPTAFVWYFINTSANYFPFFYRTRGRVSRSKRNRECVLIQARRYRDALSLSFSLSSTSQVTEIPRANVCTRMVPRTHILHA